MDELTTEFGFFWLPKTSMVYPALRKLEKRGLIKINKEHSDLITNVGINYELTEKGVKELEKFKTDFHPPSPFFKGEKFKPRSTPFKKFHFWKKFVDVETVIEHLLSYREHLEEELTRINEKVKELRNTKEFKDAFHEEDNK